jgi:hypothetical protein
MSLETSPATSSATNSAADPLPSSFGQAWNDFWFRPVDPRPLAAVRIGAGITLLLYVLSWGNAAGWLATNGLLPARATTQLLEAQPLEQVEPGRPGPIRGLTFLGDSPSVVTAVQFLLGIAAAMLAAGCFTRVTAVIVWLLFLWFAHRATVVSGATEPILAALLFYLAWSPCQLIWSVDAWWRQRREASAPKPANPAESWLPAPVLANIAQRLIQLHLACLVFAMAEAKLQGPVWWDGDAVWYLTANTLSRPVDLSFLRGRTILINAWTHAIILVEVLFPFAIWVRWSRGIVLAVAAVVWLTLPLLTGEWLFPVAMAAGLLAFVPAAWWVKRD